MAHKYLLPTTVAEVMHILALHGGEARVIAGGTDLLLDMQDGKFSPNILVDISRVADLGQITIEDGYVYIGAATTHAEVVASNLIQQQALALAHACRKVGSLQIRNVATVVGNVITANPAADAAVALAAFGAELLVMGVEGERVVPLAAAYAGICRSSIRSESEFVTAIRFPLLGKNEGVSYIRMEQRKALSLPMLAISVRVSLMQESFDEVQIFMAPVGPGPQHALDAEAFLRGKEVSTSTMQQAGELARKQATFRSSAVRGSREYRLGVLPALVQRALDHAVTDARGREEVNHG